MLSNVFSGKIPTLLVSVCSNIKIFKKVLFQYLRVITGLLSASVFFLVYHFCPISVLLFKKNRGLDTLTFFRTLEFSISLTNVTQLMLIDTSVS